MRKLSLGLLIFIAGVSLGWFAQRDGSKRPPETDSPATRVPAPAPPQEAAAPRRVAPGGRVVDDLAPLLADNAFDAALQHYDVLQRGGDEAAVERAREQILSRARALLGANRASAAGQLLELYLLAEHLDVEARMLLADAYAGRNAFRAAIDALYEARGYAWQADTLRRLERRIRAVVAAEVNALQTGNKRSALLELYQHLTQLEPGYAPYFLGLADAQLALDDAQGARRSLQLVEQDPDVGSEARVRLEQLSRNEAPADAARGSAALSRTLGVPLQRHGNHFLVDARLADGSSVRLLIDTGASMTILTPPILAGGGYKDTGQRRIFSTANGRVTAPVYRLDALSVGDWQVSQIEVGVLELADSPHIDGLLGMNFLRHFQFFIDQNQAVLRLSVQGP
jgi:clan AA aspartic protease (TIGR02281 family)